MRRSSKSQSREKKLDKGLEQEMDLNPDPQLCQSKLLLEWRLEKEKNKVLALKRGEGERGAFLNSAWLKTL